MNKQLVADLSQHLCGQLIETVNRTMAIIERHDVQLSVAVSAYMSALVSLLRDAESDGVPPAVLAALRKQAALSILHGPGHDAIIDHDGNKVEEAS